MELLSRMGAVWRRLNPNQKLLFGTLGAAFVVMVVSLGLWVARPEYGVLFANLDPADGSGIIDELSSQNITYRVEGGGRTILIPKERVYETRLSLAGRGLPGSGSGYEILDTNKLGWTDFVQKFQYRRALEGEIARTIQSIAEIQAARVHLATPEPSLFINEEKPATASVMVRLRPGGRLSGANVQGIVHLVSSAVENLSPENVTVIDMRGNLLSQPKGDQLLGATADQISIVRGLEEQLGEKVQTLLETVLGPGKSVVRIAAEMDFQKAERTVESYDADSPVVRSEERSEGSDTEGGRSETSTTNYEISRTVERIVSPSGNVRRITASVFVDGTYRDLADGSTEYVPREAGEMQKFEGIIRNAIGFDAARGDQLTVENIAFDTSYLDRERMEMEKTQRMQMITDVGGRVVTIVVILVLLLFLARSLKRMRLAPGPATKAEVGRRVDVRSAEVMDEFPELPMDNPRAVQIQTKVKTLAQESPDSLARLIRMWVKDAA